MKPKCPYCKSADGVYSGNEFDAKDCEFKCECCGAMRRDGEWKKLCAGCGKEVDELVGFFVPHLCQECLDAFVKVDVEAGNICGMCRQPRSVCCC